MTRSPALLLAFALFAWLMVPARAHAQFETASRAFHNATGFQLDGRHRDVPCQSCHINNVYKGTPAKCIDCHWVRRQDDKYRLQLGAQCDACHRTSSWTTVRWDHGAMTGMPLNGAHKTLSCETCHKSASFSQVQATCITCHRKDFEAARTPNHVAAGFPTACEACHRVSASTWQDATFNHNSVFALVGQHAQATCASCHVNNVFKGTPRDCISCHRPQYDRTTAPNHAAAGFPTTCEGCHRPTDASWSGTAFNHNAVFPLVGLHAQQACATCHLNNVFKGTSRVCVGCHRAQYDRTTSPNHAAAGFPTSCESCHRATDTSWTQGTFSHRFPITSGPHKVSCNTCHNTGSYQVFTCLVCHEHDRAIMDEKHKGRTGYRYDSLACYSCHPNGRH